MGTFGHISVVGILHGRHVSLAGANERHHDTRACWDQGAQGEILVRVPCVHGGRCCDSLVWLQLASRLVTKVQCVIDKFHFRNHVGVVCRRDCSPYKVVGG